MLSTERLMSKRKQKSFKRKKKTKPKNDKKDVLPRVVGENINQRKSTKEKYETGISSNVVALPRIPTKHAVDGSCNLTRPLGGTKHLECALPCLKNSNQDRFVRKHQLKTSCGKMMSSADDIDPTWPRKDKKITSNFPDKMPEPAQKINNDNIIMVKIRVNGEEAQLRKMPRPCYAVSDESKNPEPGMEYVNGGVSAKAEVELRDTKEQYESRDEGILKDRESLCTDCTQEVFFEEIPESRTDKFRTHRQHRKNKSKEKPAFAKSKSKSSSEKEISDPGSEVPPDRKSLLTTKEFIVEGLDKRNHDNSCHRKPKTLAISIRKPKVSRRKGNGDNYGIHGCKLLGNAVDIDEYVIAMVRLYNCHDDVTLCRVEEYHLCQGS